MRNPWLNVGFMMMGQGSSLAASMTTISFAVLIGAALANDPALATLPSALVMIATAVTTGPLSLLMGRFGRRFGFLTGAISGVLAVALGVFAVVIESFALFCAATSLLGLFNASAQYYRFAAAEGVAPAQAPKAVSMVLLGGILAALTVPTVTAFSDAALALPHHGGAFAAAGFYAALAVFPALFVRFTARQEAEKTAVSVKIPLWDILKRPAFATGVITAAGGQALMNMLMTATPLAMAHAGHMAQHSTSVIQAHVIAMFLPSLISGWLITKLGVRRVIMAGLLAMLGCVFAARAGLGVGHFTLSLVLLGLGWNFLFVSGTTLVAQSHKDDERARVQGVNEIIVFGTAAAAALSSGALLKALSWHGLAASSVVLILLVALANLAGFIQARRMAAQP